MRFIRWFLGGLYRIWKANILGKIVILIGLCFVCFLFLLPFAPGAEERAATSTAQTIAQETEIAKATATPKPTNTLQPTVTSTLTPIPTGTPEPTSKPAPTNTPTPERTPTDTPDLADISEDVFDSGGLGLAKAAWEKEHRETGKDILGPIYDERYIIIFIGNNIQYIERQWSTNNSVTSEAVETESKNLIPADSQLIETYSPEGRPETIVNLYLSESLKSRFDADWWIGGEPGNFTVQYNVLDGKVTRMIIATGNNP